MASATQHCDSVEIEETMKILSVVFGIWLVLTSVLAWEKEDHEIFDLVSALEGVEGKGTTFYSFLGVPSTATASEITKAFRKRSIQLHPDKNLGVKGIHDRYARLSVIAEILKNKESRERYDFFYKNGVPKWRGTGYYYSRFRPGLGTVFTFLTLLTSILQYVVQRITYKKDLARIDFIVRRAQSAAWGPKMVPISGQRKVKVNLGAERDVDGDVVGNKYLDMVVDGSGVYLLESNGNLHPIDTSSATKPSVANTWFIALIKTAFHVAQSALFKAPSSEKKLDSKHDSGSDSEEHASNSSTPSSDEAVMPVSGSSARRKPASKAGGVRRKNIRK